MMSEKNMKILLAKMIVVMNELIRDIDAGNAPDEHVKEGAANFVMALQHMIGLLHYIVYGSKPLRSFSESLELLEKIFEHITVEGANLDGMVAALEADVARIRAAEIN